MKPKTDYFTPVISVCIAVLAVLLAITANDLLECGNEIRALRIENSDRLVEIAALQNEKASRAELMGLSMDALDLQQRLAALEKKP